VLQLLFFLKFVSLIKRPLQDSKIQDKDSLSKFRKLIEQRMEIFKDVERENKMKPHSKQGLTAEDKLDPKEKEKCDTIEWLNVCFVLNI